ncbi:endonuclease domain-containing protein [Geodermatophilus sp. SYSU D00691]
MPVPPARPPQLRGTVFRGTDVVARGLLTAKQLRSSAWRRVRQDVYADAELPLTHRLLVAAVGLALPTGAGFGGRSAALLWGARDIAGPDDPVEVVLPVGRRWNAGPGVAVRSLLPGRALVRRGLWRCTSPEDTAVDLARFTPLDEAVVLLDRLVHEGVVRLDPVRSAAAELPPCRGSARARQAVALADGFAESPQETRLRLLLVRAGLPPVVQFRVFDDDGFVARVDFAYPDLKIAVEYDGLWHGERAAFLADRARMNRLTAAGWVVLHVTADDLRHPQRLVARLLALRARRLREANTR